RHTRFSRDWSSDVCSSDLLGTLAQRDHRDDRADTDDDAQHRQERAQLVGADRAQRDVDRFADDHRRLLPATTAGRPAARAGEAARTLAHAVRELLLLRLEPRDRDEDDLVAFLETAHDLRVVPVVHAQHDRARLDAGRRLHENDARTDIRIGTAARIIAASAHSARGALRPARAQLLALLGAQVVEAAVLLNLLPQRCTLVGRGRGRRLRRTRLLARGLPCWRAVLAAIAVARTEAAAQRRELLRRQAEHLRS